MGTLFIVSTPIGNLSDITLRALEILKSADLILCEDTRVTKKLLDHYKITTPTQSYHEHSKLSKINYIVDLLKQGKNLALVSDAGTPGISDPGNKLIGELEGVEIIPIPGPSAVITALSISGFNTNKFIFLGFPPVKNKRDKFFQEMAIFKYPVVIYESTHRIIKTLNELPERNIVVCRELTKKFESIYRGTPGEVIEQLEKGKIKGEFVIVVRPREGQTTTSSG